MQLTPEELQAVLSFPLAQPPPGVTPNFKDPQSIAYQLYITAGVCVALMLFFSLMRPFSGSKSGRKVIICDEVVFTIGLVLCLAFVSIAVVCVSKGNYGKHSWEVLLGAFTRTQVMLSLLVEVVSPLAIGSMKVSVLILYLRGFGTLRWMRNTCIVASVFVIGHHAAMCVAYGAMCGPSPSKGYSQLELLAAITSDTCKRANLLIVIQGVGNSAIDIFLLILPLPAIWQLQLPLRRRLKASAMLLIGICACVSSFIALATRVKLYNNTGDSIRLAIPTMATAMAEMAAGVIVCCGPSTMMVYRLVQAPVTTWLSKLQECLFSLHRLGSQQHDTADETRPQPLLQLGPKTYHSRNSEPELPRIVDSDWRPCLAADPIRAHQGADTYDDAWIDTTNIERGVYSLRPLRRISQGISKTTDIKVSHTSK